MTLSKVFTAPALQTQPSAYPPDVRVKIKEAGQSLQNKLLSKNPQTPDHRLFVQQGLRIAQIASRADTAGEHELNAIAIELSWVALTSGLLLGDSQGQPNSSCTNDCYKELLENTRTACGEGELSWACGCCVWPNLTHVACLADCIV